MQLNFGTYCMYKKMIYIKCEKRPYMSKYPEKKIKAIQN